jgi:hypothetical protein
MKSYMPIRDKCDYKKQSNISFHVEDKYNEIRFMEININSFFPILRGDPNKVETSMKECYSSFLSYKIINNNYSIYNFIRNYRKIRNSIYNMVKMDIYPINICAKITPRLVDHLLLK